MRRRCSSHFAICLLIGAMTSQTAESGEPTLFDRLRSEDADERRSALWDIGGEDARDPFVMAEMTKLLDDTDPSVREAAVRSYLVHNGDRETLVPLLSDQGQDVRLSVARVFVKEGIHLDRAVETLTRLMAEGDRFVDVWRIKESLGGARAAQVATQLVEIIAASEDGGLVNAAQILLARYDGLRPNHADRLLDVLDAARVETRRAAATALRAIARDCALPIAPFMIALTDEDSHVRASAAVTLLQLDREHTAAETCLRGILEGRDEDVQRVAVDAVGQFPEAASNLIPELIELLGVRDRSVRWSAMKALSHVSAGAVLPLLIAEVVAPDALTTHVYFWESIARLSGEYGVAAREGVPALIKLSKHAHADVVFAATTALGTVGVGDSAAIDRLREVLAAPDVEPRIRVAALKSLASAFGSDDARRAELRAALRALLADPDQLVSANAASVLVSVDEDVDVVLPVLESLLESDDYDTVSLARDALCTLGPRAAVVIPALIKMLESEKQLTGDFLARYARAKNLAGCACRDWSSCVVRVGQ